VLPLSSNHLKDLRNYWSVANMSMSFVPIRIQARKQSRENGWNKDCTRKQISSMDAHAVRKKVPSVDQIEYMMERGFSIIYLKLYYSWHKLQHFEITTALLYCFLKAQSTIRPVMKNRRKTVIKHRNILSRLYRFS
jgi:hypothetical protein